MTININCDGGSRGNPGPAASAFVVTQPSQNASVGKAGNLQHKCGKYLGIATNNVAEYNAVIMALEWLSQNQHTARFYLDSNLVVNQINGLFKVKDGNLRGLLMQVRELEAKISTPITYSYIPREQNSEADLLVNETLDKEIS